MAIAYLGVGSNMGYSKAHLDDAIEHLSMCGTVTKVSFFYKTEPVGDIPQDWYLNCVVKLKTKLSPHDLLKELLSIEKNMGRVRTMKNSPRIIDIDILTYDNLVISEADLAIPHPRFHERRFVLIPFAEIAPDVLHPTLKKSILELLKDTSDSSKVLPDS